MIALLTSGRQQQGKNIDVSANILFFHVQPVVPIARRQSDFPSYIRHKTDRDEKFTSESL